MQAIVTYCNMQTDAQTFPQPVDNPLASLARVMLCITVNISNYNTPERARSASGAGLMQNLTLLMRIAAETRSSARGMGGLRMILNKPMPSENYVIFCRLVSAISSVL